jgi:hypothetical protein
MTRVVGLGGLTEDGHCVRVGRVGGLKKLGSEFGGVTRWLRCAVGPTLNNTSMGGLMDGVMTEYRDLVQFADF